jgi:hypothetical protein
LATLAAACGIPEGHGADGGFPDGSPQAIVVRAQDAAADDDADLPDGLDAGLPDAGPQPPDASRPPRDAGPRFPDAGRPIDRPDGGPHDLPWLEVQLTDTAHRLLGVDPSGTLFALLWGGDPSQLWTSRDAVRWFPRPAFRGHEFLRMAALLDGVLLADTTIAGSHVLARSDDHGQTWSEVLPLGDRRMLQPRSVAELRGTVFLAEYQVASQEPVPIHVWASEDRGATWQVRATLEGYRHAHGLLADPLANELWAFMGDPTGAMLRSADAGATWSVVVPAPWGVVVDAVLTPEGLLFGTDGLYVPAFPRIERLLAGDQVRVLRPLPAPSYSIDAVRGGGYLLGTTHEAGGDIYPPGDDAAHLFASPDGWSWTEVLAYDRADPAEYGRLDVYWDLPDGRVLVEFANAAGLGTGFLVARAVLR